MDFKGGFRPTFPSSPATVLWAQGIRTPKEVSDHYLCEMAVANSALLATGIKHPTAWRIP